MTRRLLVGGLVAVALLSTPVLGQADVQVNLGIHLPGPPALVAVPAHPAVVYAPSVRANYFSYGGRYYVFNNGGWYVARGYNGPWYVVAPEFVPRPILTVPVRYYHAPPPAWVKYRREAPPRWDGHYGRKWNDRHDRDWERDHDRDGDRGDRGRGHGKGRN